jgi:uncharacterized membrane protein (Fun14 family)
LVKIIASLIGEIMIESFFGSEVGTIKVNGNKLGDEIKQIIDHSIDEYLTTSY